MQHESSAGCELRDPDPPLWSRVDFIIYLVDKRHLGGLIQALPHCKPHLDLTPAPLPAVACSPFFPPPLSSFLVPAWPYISPPSHQMPRGVRLPVVIETD